MVPYHVVRRANKCRSRTRPPVRSRADSEGAHRVQVDIVRAQKTSNNPGEPKLQKARDTTTKNPSTPIPNQSYDTTNRAAIKQWIAQIGDFTCLASVPRVAPRLCNCAAAAHFCPDIHREGESLPHQRETLHEGKTVIAKLTSFHPQRQSRHIKRGGGLPHQEKNIPLYHRKCWIRLSSHCQ